MSNWDKRPLRLIQIHYGVADSFVLLLIFEKMRAMIVFSHKKCFYQKEEEIAYAELKAGKEKTSEDEDDIEDEDEGEGEIESPELYSAEIIKKAATIPDIGVH